MTEVMNSPMDTHEPSTAPGFFEPPVLTTENDDGSRVYSPRSKRQRDEMEEMIREDMEENASSPSEEKYSTQDTSSAKRHKSEKCDFKITMMNSKPFKKLTDLVSPVLEQCNFNILNKPGRFSGITINSMDPSKISMIVAKLKCDEVYPSDMPRDTGFCVSTDMFATLLKNAIKPNSALEMKRAKTSSNILMRGYNPTKRNYEATLEIPTLDKTDDSPQLNMIGYKYVAEFDLQSLRGIVKTAQNGKINASTIRFRIYEGITQQTDAKKNETPSKVKVTKIKVTIDGGPSGCKSTHSFRSVTCWENKNDDESTVITTSDNFTDDDDYFSLHLPKVLDEKYSTKHLHLFMKSMERQNIILRFSPKKPLVIQYPLGDEETVGYCNFILAPNQSTEEEQEANQDESDED